MLITNIKDELPFASTVFLLYKGGLCNFSLWKASHRFPKPWLSFFPKGFMHLSSWLTDLRVINYSGTFQFGLEETPTHQTHRGGLPICRSNWNMRAINLFFPPRLWKEKAHIPIKVWHHQSTRISFKPSDYPCVVDYSVLIRKLAPASFLWLQNLCLGFGLNEYCKKSVVPNLFVPCNH